MKANEYWNAEYASRPLETKLNPSKFIVDMTDRLQKGKLLEIGMGLGHESVYLASKGFQVKGFDISQEAVNRAKSLAEASAVQADFSQADLDMFIFGLMEYDTILMHNFRPSLSRYYYEIIRALKQGGTLLVDSLLERELDEPLGKDEGYRNIYFKSNEVLRQLKNMQILYYEENKFDGKYRLRCLAKKPTDKDAKKYNLFDIQSDSGQAEKPNYEKIADNFFKK